VQEFPFAMTDEWIDGWADGIVKIRMKLLFEVPYKITQTTQFSSA